MHIQNLSIQVIPINTTEAYAHIDAAIAVIEASKLPFQVTPFSTVVEGTLDALQNLIKEIQNVVFEHGAEEIVLNMQIHAKKNQAVFLNEKTDKFQ